MRVLVPGRVSSSPRAYDRSAEGDEYTETKKIAGDGNVPVDMTKVEDIVKRQSDNESRCARYLAGGAAVQPDDESFCYAYIEGVYANPQSTITQTIATYLVGEQYIAGALCNTVLATNPYSWAGCQIVGHIFGEEFGKWVTGLFSGDTGDCRNGKNAVSFARDVFARLLPAAVDSHSAKKLLEIADNEGNILDLYLGQCGRNANDGDNWNTDDLTAFVNARMVAATEFAIQEHDQAIERVVHEAKEFATTNPESLGLLSKCMTEGCRRTTMIAQFQRYIEGNVLSAREFGTRALFYKDNWGFHIPPGELWPRERTLEEIESAWQKSETKAMIDAAYVVWNQSWAEKLATIDPGLPHIIFLLDINESMPPVYIVPPHFTMPPPAPPGPIVDEKRCRSGKAQDGHCVDGVDDVVVVDLRCESRKSKGGVCVPPMTKTPPPPSAEGGGAVPVVAGVGVLGLLWWLLRR